MRSVHRKGDEFRGLGEQTERDVGLRNEREERRRGDGVYQPFLILNEYILRIEPLYQRPEIAKHGDTIVCPGKVQDSGCFDDDVVRLVDRLRWPGHMREGS